MCQKYLPKISEGDKRVFLINGKVSGVISRVPKKGSFLSNMSKGAKPTLRVHKILAAAGLLDAPIIREQPIKAAPGKKRLERENEAKEAAEAPAEAGPAEAAPAEAAPTSQEQEEFPPPPAKPEQPEIAVA